MSTVRINRIYTRTGDDGTTGLADGSRALKSSLLIQSIGDIDELNTWIAWCLGYANDGHKAVYDILEPVRSELFEFGAALALLDYPQNSGDKIKDSDIVRLENSIDQITEKLPELRSFVLPGGSPMNCALHTARAVCRRAERSLVELNISRTIPTNLLKYINRLSDLLFALTRYEATSSGRGEILWVPRKG
jgi:cob(I)alamin adenosyltransferase